MIINNIVFLPSPQQILLIKYKYLLKNTEIEKSLLLISKKLNKHPTIKLKVSGVIIQ